MLRMIKNKMINFVFFRQIEQFQFSGPERFE